MSAVWVEISPTNMASKTIFFFLIILYISSLVHNRLYTVMTSQPYKGQPTFEKTLKYTKPGISHFSTGEVLRVYYWTFIISPNFLRLVTLYFCVLLVYSVYKIYNLLFCLSCLWTTMSIIFDLDVVQYYLCCTVVLVFSMYFITSTFLSYLNPLSLHSTLITINSSISHHYQTKGLSAAIKSGSQLWHGVWCLSINR
jgi:hypothetical protein